MPPRSISKPALRPLPRSQSTREPAHLPLHRRLLFPYHAPDKSVPPLIGVTHPSPEWQQVNERLLHLIALALRAYILSWYPRLSPRDRTLLPALHQHIIHPILSPILTRIYAEPSNLSTLLLLDLPTIIALHIETYWSAREALHLGLLARGEEPLDPHKALGEAYHARLPLLNVAITPVPGSIGTEDPDSPSLRYEEGVYALSPLYLTSLSDSLLRLYLPAKEYASNVERTMGREILGRTILGSGGRRLGEAWFWWQMGLKLLGEPGRPRVAKHKGNGANGDFIPSFAQWVTVIWTLVSKSWSWTIKLVATLRLAEPAEPKFRNVMEPWMRLGRASLGVDGHEEGRRRTWRLRLAWGIVEGINTLLAPILDRLLPYLLLTLLLTPKTALQVIDLIEHVLFPLNGYFGPSPMDPTPTEARKLRDRMEERITELLPMPVEKVLLGAKGEVGWLLDPVGDRGCNAHFVGMMLDAAVGSLVPELVAGYGASPVDQVDDEEDSVAGEAREHAEGW